MASLRLARFSLIALCVGLAPAVALAQADEVPQPIDLEPTPELPEDEEAAAEEEPYRDEAELPAADEPAPRPAAPDRRPGATTGAPAEAKPPAAEAAAPTARTEDPSRPPPKPIVVPAAGDAELLGAWEKWWAGNATLDLKAADAAQAELLQLKDDLGITALDSFAVGFLRAAQTRRAARDPQGAIKFAQAAVRLAPDLPVAHVGLAQAHFAADWTAVGAYGSALKEAVFAQLRDPRFFRPALVDLAATTLFALMATAALVVLVLFGRRVRYFLHDFHHLFPRAAARWQTGAIALLLLSLPFVFRLGLVPVLLALFAAVALYLGLAERIVAAALIALVGLLPLAADVLVERTAFAGTQAEDVFEVERGGVNAAPAVARLADKATAGTAAFEELFALGRYELRRGRLDAAIEHLKKAATLRPKEARLLTNLGNALMAKADPDGAVELYRTAAQVDPTLAAAFYNVSRLHNRRAATLRSELVGAELDKANVALTTAQRLDESLLARRDPPEDNLLHNRLLLSPGLSAAEIARLAKDPARGDKVASQLARAIAGTAAAPWAYLYPALLAALALALGFSAFRIGAAKACEKCGRPVCRRCDPEIGAGSQLCAQCVNVFARKGVVPPPVKVRKQAEVDRHRAHTDRLSYVLGLLCSGAGHLFSGVPVRGALYAFVFLFVVFNAFFRLGVLRGPYDALPPALKLAPLAVVFVLVYLFSLRGLYKRQTG